MRLKWATSVTGRVARPAAHPALPQKLQWRRANVETEAYGTELRPLLNKQ